MPSRWLIWDLYSCECPYCHGATVETKTTFMGDMNIPLRWGICPACSEVVDLPVGSDPSHRMAPPLGPPRTPKPIPAPPSTQGELSFHGRLHTQRWPRKSRPS
jgi:hypothetical protein